MSAWDKVKQDLATAGYSESQKKNFKLVLQNVKSIKVSSGVIETTYRFLLNYDVQDKDVFWEVAALFNTMNRLEYCSDEKPFVNNWDIGEGCIRVFALGEFVDERSI